MDKKKIIYLCKATLGETFDFDYLVDDVIDEDYSYESKIIDNIYSEAGRAEIAQDVADGYNTIAIAAGPKGEAYEGYNFPDCLVEWIDLVSLVMLPVPPDEENEDPEENDVQMAAGDYIRLALTKLDKMELPEPFILDAPAKKILIVGGGVSGLSAAVEAAAAGYESILVEKTDQLGGKLNNNKMSTPLKAPFRDLEETPAAELIAKATESDKVEVFTETMVESISGAPGKFDVKLSNGTETRCGAIIQAAGWEPYDPTKLADEYGYGKPNVVTNVEFEKMVKDGNITRPSDGGPIKTAVFIQCAGSRDQNHLPYCSAICCQVSMKQANYLKEKDSEIATYIVYRDVRTPGQFEEFYRRTQEDGTVFIRAQNKTIGDGFVEAEDELLGEKVKIEDVDLVVLATGMVPVSAPEFKPAEIIAAEQKKIEERTEDPPIEEKYGAPLLNLTYRQNGELPLLKNGFNDSNFICFPYETRRTGIYTCGPIRRPMGIAAAREDAAGAVMKAIQCVESSVQGLAVHPRSGDTSYPAIDLKRCTQCRRCTDECPFGAYDEDEKTNPLPNPSRCRRCGVCMGACPERVISFKNYSVSIIGNMIKAIEVPDEEDEKPRVLVLCCENDAFPAIQAAALRGAKWSPYVRFVPLRCLGSVNLVWIADALSSGIDGILLLGCKSGDDYQCHFVRGSELAKIRLGKIAETLQRLVLEEERIKYEQVAITDYERIPEIIDEFMEGIDDVGPNPYKGF